MFVTSQDPSSVTILLVGLMFVFIARLCLVLLYGLASFDVPPQSVLIIRLSKTV